MPRELYPEHKTTPIMDVVRVCVRCKSGLVYTPFNSGPMCHKCGDNGREGEPYVRLSVVQTQLDLAGLSSLAVAVVEEGKFHITPLIDTTDVRKVGKRRGNHRR